MQLIEKLNLFYLGEAEQQAVSLLFADTNSKLDSFFRIRIAMLVSFVAACLLIYFVLYRPLIQSLQEDVNRTRSMLLMIPAHVMSEVGIIRKFVRSIISNLGR
eukprot:TRINITY_DN7775_c0_g1_i1.p2 TRINITY_DN7775_c0_g1~~TRINITY_DN7775_c0_g1_i1.p2  ORF type:complete len:103 (+),score=24.68 TRINITY_DN7775_c0_g1_i1:60-368(+)